MKVLTDCVCRFVGFEEPLKWRDVPVSDQVEILPQLREGLYVFCEVSSLRPFDVHLDNHLAYVDNERGERGEKRKEVEENEGTCDKKAKEDVEISKK